MTPNEFYYSHSKEVIKVLAQEAGTSVGNFKQIAIANGNVSAALAARLSKASNGVMTELEILYPERYPKATDQTESAA